MLKQLQYMILGGGRIDRAELQEILAARRAYVARAQTLNPPACLQASHRIFLDALSQYVRSAELALTGINAPTIAGQAIDADKAALDTMKRYESGLNAC